MTEAANIHAVIIDDEMHCIESLSSLLSKHCPFVKVNATYSSAKEGMLGIRKSTPELLFLDVEMPWMNGIELLQALGDITFKVIFTTAHDQYALQAFRLSAIDYLLKPIESGQLIEAVGRVADFNKEDFNEGIKHLAKNLENQLPHHRIAIPTKEGLEFILIEDIMYCIADSNYTHIFCQGGKALLMSKPLKELDVQLRPYGFIRIHHSSMINPNHMLRYVRGNAGYVVMADNKSLSVSRAKKQELLTKMGGV